MYFPGNKEAILGLIMGEKVHRTAVIGVFFFWQPKQTLLKSFFLPNLTYKLQEVTERQIHSPT